HADDGIRDFHVTGVQTCALPIYRAIAAPATARDPEAWLLRGFVYKDLFKAAPTAEADTIRAEAMSSLLTCLELDQGGVYRENAEQAYDFLARTIFNDAARALNAEQ